MRTILRTIMILLAAFFVGRAVPADAILLPLISMLAVFLALLDCMLYLSKGRGLIDHLEKTEP